MDQVRKANLTDANIKPESTDKIDVNQTKLAAKTCTRYQARETSLDGQKCSVSGFCITGEKDHIRI